MEDCCNCLSLKKQLEDIKQKHLLDFRTIKQKIISTDSLIRSYQEKCQEFDKQKKCVAELVSKLDIARRSADVVKLQLKKSFELVEPLQKKCNELEREKVLQYGEIQAQQDRLRGLENLVNQLQSVIKENDVSNNSLKLDASLHTEELEEYKKSQKKNEAQISKLNEQVLTEKKTNKALKKELTKSQNQVEALLSEAEESKELIATLQQQQKTGQSNDCVQQRNTSLEKQIMTLKTEADSYKETIRKLKEELRKAKQQNTDEKLENKIKSPTTPRRSPRKRKSVTPKQGKETCASLDQKRPLTRLQQKHLIEEIEKKSVPVKSPESIFPSRQESLTSESEGDADEMGMLLDKVNEMLDTPYCPSLSPLPPSPILDANSVDAFGSNDPDYFSYGNDDDAIDDNDNQNYTGVTDEPDKNDLNDANVNNSKDNLDDKLNKHDHDKILQNESRGEKRELVDCSDTFMTLRSKKRIKSATSDSGPSSNDENDPQNVKRTKSVEGELLVDISGTGSKRIEGVTEGVLEVKPKRRRRRRTLSSNDDPEEQCFESSDTSTVESHVSETRKHSSDSFTAENGTNMETVVSEASDENCSEKKRAETNYKENDEVSKCLQDIIDTVAVENSGKICDASFDVYGTESCTQNEQIGTADCFDVVNDLVVNSDLSALQEDLVKSRDNVVNGGDKIDDHNENDKTAKAKILDPVDDINTTVRDEIKQNIKNINPTIGNDFSSSSFDGSGHPEATSYAIATKNTCKIQHETRHKASTISDCVSTSSGEVSRTIESDLSKSFVDENGFLKAPSDDLVTTNTCKTQHEPKDEASTISDCVSTGSEKEITGTDGDDLNKSSFDQNGSPKATRHDLITTNTLKTQHETKHEASTISDCVFASNKKEVIRTDANDLNSLSVDESGFSKATSHDLITTNTRKTQRETRHKASTIFDCVSTSSEDVPKTIESDYSKLSVDESGFLKAPSHDLVTTITCKAQEPRDKASTISKSVSTSIGEEVTRKSSVHESGFPKATSPDLIATNTRQSPQEPIDEASAISACVLVSNEVEVTRADGNYLNRSSVDENGFLKAPSHESITTNTCKKQHKTKHKASTTSDCVSTGGEKEVIRTDGNDLSKSSVVPEAPSFDSVTKDNLKTEHETKDKPSTVSDCVSASNEKKIDTTIESDLKKPAFVKSGFSKASSFDSVTKKTQKTQHETSKEAVYASESNINIPSQKSTTQVIGKDPLIGDEITSTTSPSKDSFDSLEQITPLSPIPNTPKKGGRSTELPCFDSLGHLPLSPIPPSPPPRADEESTSSNITFDENVVQNPKEARVDKQQKLNKNELPQDCLRRYPGVNEVQYTVFILTKLKNKEVTLEDLISAFSVQKNVKNHNPICNGIITVLKLTHEDEEHALMEKCAERYERCCEGTGDPIVSEFELQVLIAVNRLCKIQRHSNLLIKLVKWSGMNVCELFNSGKNDAGLLAMCRLYTGASRLMGEGSYIRVLCYDLLKQNKRYLMTERMILSMALVWPKVLGEGVSILTFHPEAVSISGPPYSPFLATLQVTLLSREMSCEQTRQCLQRLWGWCDIPRGNNVLEWLAKDLAHILRATNDATSDESPECSSTSKDVAFEIIKSLELLAIIMGWKWTNNVLIREILWPFFNEWKIQLFDVKQTVLDNESQKAERNAKALNTGDCQPNIMVESEFVNNEQLVENSSEAVSFKHDGNMDLNIANILHLLGVLGSERLQKGEIVNLDAVINLMCAILACPACEKVSFNIQHTAASALLDIVSADPVKIMQVLEHWRDSNEALTGQFARRMKDARSHMWSNIIEN